MGHIKPSIYILSVRQREEPDAQPIAYLLIERNETIEYLTDGSVYRASVHIEFEGIGSPYGPLINGKGSFSGGFERNFTLGMIVSLTSTSCGEGSIFIEPTELQGHLVGTYFMNLIVGWAKQWPEAEVQKIKLVPEQPSKPNKDRRNRFYEQFGLVFDYADPDHLAGVSRPMLASMLTPSDAWRVNVREHNFNDFVGSLLDDVYNLQIRLSTRITEIENLNNEINAMSKPFCMILFNWLYRLFNRGS